jgi:hypothetical protein
MVDKASSLQEAKQILRDYAPTLARDSISLDSENRVDISGDIDLRRLFGRRSHKTLPLVFGKITGNFQAVDLGLTTLEGSPYWIERSFDVRNNKLTTLKGGPSWVGLAYYARYNPLTDLDGLASHIGSSVSFDYTKDLPLLRTLVAQKIWPSPDQVELEKILVKYAGQGKRAMFDCQKELEDAGFEGNARW